VDVMKATVFIPSGPELRTCCSPHDRGTETPPVRS
jgi:hypothetical protein